MIVSKRSISDIYNGCLTYLRDDLTAKVPEGKQLNNDIKGLVGSKTIYDVYSVPFSSPPAYYEIYFGNKHIFPTSYSLMGRRINGEFLLKGWDFFGKNILGEWVLLGSQSDKQFKQNEIRNYKIKARESFTGFKLQMTEEDSFGYWALCPGQIEVFGDIYSHYFSKNMTIKSKYAHHIRTNSFVYVAVLIVLS